MGRGLAPSYRVAAIEHGGPVRWSRPVRIDPDNLGQGCKRYRRGQVNYAGPHQDGGTMKLLDRLDGLCAQIPASARADWRGTNHYEIHTDDEVWWLDLWETLRDMGRDAQAQPDGQRLGALLDLACASRRALPLLARLIRAQAGMIRYLEWDGDTEFPGPASLVRAEYLAALAAVEKAGEGTT